jgi:hypothetical protein
MCHYPQTKILLWLHSKTKIFSVVVPFIKQNICYGLIYEQKTWSCHGQIKEKMTTFEFINKTSTTATFVMQQEHCCIHEYNIYHGHFYKQRIGITLHEQTSSRAALNLNNILIWMFQIYMKLPSLHI